MRTTAPKRRCGKACTWNGTTATPTNGRVVIQEARLAARRIGERTFQLSDQQWIEQAKQNREEIKYFMEQLSDALNENSSGESNSDELRDFDDRVL